MMQKFSKLYEIFEHQVFELCGPFVTEKGTDYYVPYMMNDALEDYLILKNCRLVGEYVHDTELVHEMQLVENEDGYVLAVRQGEENAFTLYFENVAEHTAFYQYHEIGHFWVKGQEHWRQLVYMIGTIYDKWKYLGKTACNAEELSLLPLMEFAPFRAWSPIHESLDDFYYDSEEGFEAIEQFAEEAKDKKMLKLVNLYRKIYHIPFLQKSMCSMLQNLFLKSDRENLYEVIWEKVEKASSQYAKREYEESLEKAIEGKRKEVEESLYKKGFEGTYPEFMKDDIKILVTEEHPFTILEWEHYEFRVHFMVSQCDKNIKQRRNSGFFEGRGRKGWIEHVE